MGIDIGAGSLKTMVVGSDGRVGGSASVDLVTASPQPRFSEQDPAHWWRALCDTAPRALAQAGIGADAVAGVSFSAGAHTPVLEDAQGRVLRPAILWSDQRSGDQVRRLRELAGDRILALAYNAPSPTWTLPQLWWLCEHEPEVAREWAERGWQAALRAHLIKKAKEEALPRRPRVAAGKTTRPHP